MSQFFAVTVIMMYDKCYTVSQVSSMSNTLADKLITSSNGLFSRVIRTSMHTKCTTRSKHLDSCRSSPSIHGTPNKLMTRQASRRARLRCSGPVNEKNVSKFQNSFHIGKLVQSTVRSTEIPFLPPNSIFSARTCITNFCICQESHKAAIS